MMIFSQAIILKTNFRHLAQQQQLGLTAVEQSRRRQQPSLRPIDRPSKAGRRRPTEAGPSRPSPRPFRVERVFCLFLPPVHCSSHFSSREHSVGYTTRYYVLPTSASMDSFVRYINFLMYLRCALIIHICPIVFLFPILNFHKNMTNSQYYYRLLHYAPYHPGYFDLGDELIRRYQRSIFGMGVNILDCFLFWHQHVRGTW